MTGAPRVTAGSGVRRDRRLGRIAGVAGAAAVAILAALPFGVNPTFLSIVTLGLVYGLFAFGLDLSWGRAGLLSVGQAAFFGLGAYAVAIGDAHGWSPVGSAAVGVLAAGAIAAAIAAVASSGTEAQSVPLLILFTIGISQLLQRAASTLTPITGGANGLSVDAPPLVELYYLVLGITVVTVVVAVAVLVRGRIGAFQLAGLLRVNRAAALGIDVRRTRMIAFVGAGAVSSLAGALYAPVAGIVTPQAVGLALSTAVLTWLAVGGKASIAGPFLGALVLTIAEQSLGGAWQGLYLFLLAAAFIVVVQVAPTGIAGAVRRALRGGTDMPRLPSARGRAPRAPGGSGAAPLLVVDGVTQRIGGATILSDVSITVGAGTCVALIGPNGAGKSTLLSVIAGDLRPSGGSVRLRGDDVTRLRVDQRARRGIGRLFQVPSVFEALSVADNRRLAALAAGTARRGSGAARASEDDLVAGELSMAERRHLELDMALEGPPDLVLLDEPAAGLSHGDTRALAQRLRSIVDESGCGMLVVEHDMELVRELADVVVVLAGGRVIAMGSMDEVVEHDVVRRAYLGVA